MSELACLFLEDNGKQLSIPLACLQAKRALHENLCLETIPLAAVLPVVNPCLLRVQQGNNFHVICHLPSQLQWEGAQTLVSVQRGQDKRLA